MRQSLNANELQRLANHSPIPRIEELMWTLRRSSSGVDLGEPVSATNLLAIYRVRLARWRSEGIPESEGLPDLVTALVEADEKLVYVARYQSLLLLVNHELSAILAIVVLKKVAEEPGTTDGSSQVSKDLW